MTASPKQVVQKRPAETIGGIASVAVIVARLFTANPDVLTAVGVVAGALPAGITWLVVTIRGS